MTPRHARITRILRRLHNCYPANPSTALIYHDPFQLLISTMLSAHCTDPRVNSVTPRLFKRFPSAGDFARARKADVEQYIYSTGFYRQKANNIIAASRLLLRKYDGKVPSDMDDLLTLPGVARKTANIVLYYGFNKVEGIAVDTHVRRVSLRLELSQSRTPAHIERDLRMQVPRSKWHLVNYLFIHHGRHICTSRAPQCERCPLLSLCHYGRSVLFCHR